MRTILTGQNGDRFFQLPQSTGEEVILRIHEVQFFRLRERFKYCFQVRPGTVLIVRALHKILWQPAGLEVIQMPAAGWETYGNYARRPWRGQRTGKLQRNPGSK